MTHKILNRELEMKLTGTVGVIWATERRIGHEPQTEHAQDLVAVLYTALANSKDRKGNPLNEDMPTLEEFTDVMTQKVIKELSDDFWKQWRELEGAPTDSSEGERGED